MTNPKAQPQPKSATPTESVSQPAAPEATPESATKVVRPGWPVTSFQVEGVPEITRDGTPLNAEQLKVAEQAAEAQNFDLEVENGEAN